MKMDCPWLFLLPDECIRFIFCLYLQPKDILRFDTAVSDKKIRFHWRKLLKFFISPTYQCDKIFRGHSKVVTNLLLLLDGRIASSSSDDKVCIWNIISGSLEITFTHNEPKIVGPIIFLLQLVDGRIVSGATSGYIYIWNLDTLSQECSLEFENLYDVLQCQDGRLVTSANDGITFWNIEKWTKDMIIDYSAHKLYQLSNGTLLSNAFDGFLYFWNTKTGDNQGIFEEETGYIDNFLEFSKTILITACTNYSLRLWNLITKQHLYSFDYTGMIRCLLPLSKTKFILSIHDRIYIQDISPLINYIDNDNPNDEEPIYFADDIFDKKVLTGHTDQVNELCLVNKNRRLISGSLDETIRIWNLESFQCERILSPNCGFILRVRSIPKGKEENEENEENDRFLTASNLLPQLRIWKPVEF